MSHVAVLVHRTHRGAWPEKYAHVVGQIAQNAT